MASGLKRQAIGDSAPSGRALEAARDGAGHERFYYSRCLRLRLQRLAQTPLGTVTGLAYRSIRFGAGFRRQRHHSPASRTAAVRAHRDQRDRSLYLSPIIQPGIYRLAAAAQGFRAIETRAFSVESYSTTRQDLNFELAGQSSDVVVTDSAPAMVHMDSPAIHRSLTQREIVEDPTNYRSVAKKSGDSGLISEILPETVPGVVQVANGAKWLTPALARTASRLRWTASKPPSGNFGSPDNVSQPSVEAIQEFTANVRSPAARAEFGGMSTITTATKAGHQPNYTAASIGTSTTALPTRATPSPSPSRSPICTTTAALSADQSKRTVRSSSPISTERKRASDKDYLFSANASAHLLAAMPCWRFQRLDSAQEPLHRSYSVQR